MVELESALSVCPQTWLIVGSGHMFGACVRGALALGLQLQLLPLRGKTLKQAQSLLPNDAISLLKVGDTVPSRLATPGVLEDIQRIRPNVILIAAWGEILSAEFLSALDAMGCLVLNLHPSPLPRYRGPSPYFWQILQGEPQLQASFHRVTAGIDTGPVVYRTPWLPIQPDDTLRTLLTRTAKHVETHFPELVESLSQGSGPEFALGIPQDETQATYQRHPSDETLRLVWSDEADRVWQVCRAADAVYPVWSVYRGMPVRFRYHGLVAGHGGKVKPGQIIRRTFSSITVQTSDPARAICLWRPHFYTVPRLLSVALQAVLLAPGAVLS